MALCGSSGLLSDAVHGTVGLQIASLRQADKQTQDMYVASNSLSTNNVCLVMDCLHSFQCACRCALGWPFNTDNRVLEFHRKSLKK